MLTPFFALFGSSGSEYFLSLRDISGSRHHTQGSTHIHTLRRTQYTSVRIFEIKIVFAFVWFIIHKDQHTYAHFFEKKNTHYKVHSTNAFKIFEIEIVFDCVWLFMYRDQRTYTHFFEKKHTSKCTHVQYPVKPPRDWLFLTHHHSHFSFLSTSTKLCFIIISQCSLYLTIEIVLSLLRSLLKEVKNAGSRR